MDSTACSEHVSQLGLLLQFATHTLSRLFTVTSMRCKQTNWPAVCEAGIEMHAKKSPHFWVEHYQRLVLSTAFSDMHKYCCGDLFKKVIERPDEEGCVRTVKQVHQHRKTLN